MFFYKYFYKKEKRENAMYDLSGVWAVKIDDGKEYEMTLPGSLDENQIGYADKGRNQWHPDAELGNAEESFEQNAPIATRFTRKYTYEGIAKIYRRIQYFPEEGKRVFLKVERARCLRLFIDEEEVYEFVPSTISTPHIYEITGRVNGSHMVCFWSDNSYPGLPHDDIVYSSAATDETQTNWNGLLGNICIYEESPIFIENIFVYPKADKIDIVVEIDADKAYEGKLTLACAALADEAQKIYTIDGKKGKNVYKIEALMLAQGIKRWDEYEGNLYSMTVSLHNGKETGDKKEVNFGIRDFGDDGTGRLALNGRRIFIRSEANCGEFPETGYSPVDVEQWMDILGRFKAYGVNMMRFHSHCPAEAAFIAADRLGMLMQPELSQWNPRNALETEESVAYYTRELQQIIRMLANHPSFVMLTLGNELQNGELGIKNMNHMLEIARSMDSTRLFANGSNTHYGERGCDPNSDFAQSQRYFGADLRGIFAATTDKGIEGFINNEYPNAMHSYDASMEQLRKDYKKPVFAFEVGQFEILPDFDELEAFQGISEPVNYRLIQDKVMKNGLISKWKHYVEATGEMSRIGYRAEIEAALRTKELSGISLLGIQDFPGQGTAIVGMMNSHLEPKPFAFSNPKEFSSFFTDRLPMIYLPKYTWETTEELKADVVVANYGKSNLTGKILVELAPLGIIYESEQEFTCPTGELTTLDTIVFSLKEIQNPTRLNLVISFAGLTNTYPIWVYPAVKPVCPDSVYETETLDEKALRILQQGGKVYLSPGATKEALPKSIKTQFTTDFWSVGTFPLQEGSMGQLIDEEHPIFADFPTEYYSNWQWWPMANTRAVILPKKMECIIIEMDSYAYLRPMAQLFECRIGAGKVLFSSMGLQDLQKYPEARALLHSVYRYMESDGFAPQQELTIEELKSIVS